MKKLQNVDNRDRTHHRWVKTGFNTSKCNICNLTKIENIGSIPVFYQGNLCVENTGCIKIVKPDTNSTESRLNYLYNFLKKKDQNPSELDFGIVTVPKQSQSDCLFFKFEENGVLVVRNTKTSQIVKLVTIESQIHLRKVVKELINKNLEK